MSDDTEPETTATRYEWERIIRRARLGAPAKAVALAMATYADRDGSRVYPGVSRLCAVTELSERSVRAGLKKLRDAGLIERVFKGGHRGVNSFTDVHRLAIPADLFERVEMLGPGEEAIPQPAPGAPHQVLTNHQPTQLQNEQSCIRTKVQTARADFDETNVIAIKSWGARR